MSNPILTFFKIMAFSILALLVWFAYWQGLRTEENIKDLKQRVAQLSEKHAGVQASERKYTDSVNELSGEVRALKDLLAAGAMVPRSAGPSNGGGTATTTAPSGTGGAPAYFSKRAQTLWGRYEDYLEEDPKPPQYPDWDTTPNLDPNGRMYCWYGDTPSDINPITSQDGRVSDLIEQYVLRRLTMKHVEHGSKYRPELAIRAEHSPDYKEWVVWMRNDAYWHTPQLDLDEYPHLKGRHKVTAHDIKFHLDMILHPEVNAAHKRSYYTECSGCEIVDDHCLIIRWKKPQYQGIEYSLNIYAVPKFVLAYDEAGEPYDEGQIAAAINDHWFYRGQNYLGCGPFEVVEMQLEDHILFRRFEDFYGPKPAIREIYRNIFDRRNIDVTKLEKGEHDYASVVPDVWYKLVNNEPESSPFRDGRIGEHWGWTTQYSFIGWKCTHPFFSDVRVRTALAMACDRPRILKTLNIGKGKVVSGPQHCNSMMYPPDLEPLPFDLDKAAALLAEAGWKDNNGDGVLEREIDGQMRDFDFVATIPTNPRFIALFEIFKEDLIKIGVKMSFDTLQWKQFKEQVIDSRDFACTTLLWSGDGWESDLSQIFHSREIENVPSSNFCEFGDAKADEMMDSLRLEFDVAERVKLQRALHKRIAELQPYVFMTTIRMPIMYWKDRLGNWEESGRYRTRPFMRNYSLIRFSAK